MRLESEDEMPEIPDSTDLRNEEEIMKIEAAKLQQVLEYLLPKDKAILLMKYQDDLSIKEIQDIMELNESAVKMRIKRARAKAIEIYHLNFPA